MKSNKNQNMERLETGLSKMGASTSAQHLQGVRRLYGGSVIKSGLLDKIKSQLKDEDIDYYELGGVKPNPRADLVYEGIKICKEHDIEFLLPVGGGSVIDTAKAIALGALDDGDFFDFYLKKRKPTKALKTGCVLTIPAAGSESSASTVITKEVDGKI